MNVARLDSVLLTLSFQSMAVVVVVVRKQYLLNENKNWQHGVCVWHTPTPEESVPFCGSVFLAFVRLFH